MNARLFARRPRIGRDCGVMEGPTPQVRLLGEGLDAIVIHTRERTGWLATFFPRANLDLTPPSDRARRDRYYTAAALYPAELDPHRAETRELVGGMFKHAWKEHRYPRLSRFARVLAVFSANGLALPLRECARVAASGDRNPRSPLDACVRAAGSHPPSRTSLPAARAQRVVLSLVPGGFQ